MKLFFERTETADEVIITYNPYFLYSILGLLVASFGVRYGFNASDVVGTVFSGVMVVLVVWRTLSMGAVKKEIRAAMKRGAQIRFTGSQFKPSDPYTVRLTKSLS